MDVTSKIGRCQQSNSQTGQREIAFIYAYNEQVRSYGTRGFERLVESSYHGYFSLVNVSPHA